MRQAAKLPENWTITCGTAAPAMTAMTGLLTVEVADEMESVQAHASIEYGRFDLVASFLGALTSSPLF